MRVSNLAVFIASVVLSALSSVQGQAVTYSKNYYSILGQNVFLYSAEFHPWRLPVPALWRDPLQKLKAAGINTVSIYTHWGLIMPSPDASSVSLEAPANRLADFLTIAKEVGMFVILRPGPYINAETTGGGMPGWVQNLDTQLRVNTTTFSQAWQPYVKAIVEAAAPFQLKAGQADGTFDTSAGTLIGIQVENEFQQTPEMEAYFDDIISFYHANGINVSRTFNALSGTEDYANNTQLNIWGQDSYPQNFDCYRPEIWASVQSYTDLDTFRPTNPASIPEFQGGSYDAWGGSTYDACAILTNASFVRVFEKSLIGDGVKFKSNYMGYGGTNWGNLAYGGLVYTSYDYGAGLDEKRMKRNKLDEMALIGSFLQSFPAFAAATVEQQGVNMGVTEQSADIFVSHMQANDSSWYVVRQSDSTSSAIATFKLSVGGNTIPKTGSMTLYGRDAIIVPVNVTLNSSSATLEYSTADVSFMGTIDGRDVLIMHGQAGMQYEFAISNASANTTQQEGVTISQQGSDVLVNWMVGESSATFMTFTSSKGAEILIGMADTKYAQALSFVPLASSDSIDFVLGQGDRIVAHGAYHIANATLSEGTLAVIGQLNATHASILEIFSKVSSVTFNGVAPASINITSYGSTIATFSAAPADVLEYELPELGGWKFNDSLPEIQPSYLPDTNWRSASLTTTSNAWFANATTANVLFADAYGFHSGGVLLWQARFNLSSSEAQAYLASKLSVHYIGGKFFASSTYLNGNFVGATDVPTQTQDVTASFVLDKTAFVEGTNVFTVLMESTGLEEVGSITSVDGYECESAVIHV
jgi:hypothetical protein